MASMHHNNVTDILFSVLKKYFSNGFRLNDYIELVRFRDFTSKTFGYPIKKEITDEILTRYIVACGTVFDGKVYPVSRDMKNHFRTMVEEYFASGAKVIFYDSFYEKNRNFLFAGSIISEEMAREMMKSFFPSLFYTQTYCGHIQGNIPVVVEHEIVRIWRDNISMNCNQISDRIIYIPLHRIQNALAQSKKFIFSSETGSYICLDRVDVLPEHCEQIRREVTRRCDEDGYAALADVPLGELGERNYELSEATLRQAVFKICLSDAFVKKGKIISMKGAQLDVRAMMCDYFRKVDRCSLDELQEFARELTTTPRPDLILDVGYTALVRTGKDSFVADHLVHFEADAVDDAIAQFVTDDFLPLKSFTTFGNFPDCGQTWNLFLLETYCRRFSRNFRFDALTMNSGNVGAVIRKSNRQEYTEILADAVFRSGIEPTDKNVAAFLIEAGYIARTSTTVKGIAARVKARRERGA